MYASKNLLNYKLRKFSRNAVIEMTAKKQFVQITRCAVDRQQKGKEHQIRFHPDNMASYGSQMR